MTTGDLRHLFVENLAYLPDNATEAETRRAWRDDHGDREEQVRELESFIRSRNIREGEQIIIAGDFDFGGLKLRRRNRTFA